MRKQGGRRFIGGGAFIGEFTVVEFSMIRGHLQNRIDRFRHEFLGFIVRKTGILMIFGQEYCGILKEKTNKQAKNSKVSLYHIRDNFKSLTK